MGKHKQIARELKRPDHFVDFWTRASQSIVSAVGIRRKPAIAVVVALVVVLIGSAIMNTWEEGKRVAASRQLAHIQKMANAELLPPPGKDSDGKDVDAKDAHKDDVTRFKTAGERQAAVLKELDQFLAGGTSSGLKAEATIMKGATLLDLGRNDDAIAAYDSALGGHSLDSRMRFLAHEGLGYAYEAKGDLDKALAAFGQLTGDATEFRGFYQDRALFHKARLAGLKGDKAGAATLYRQILDKVPDTSMKDEIVDRLAVIEAH